jgi:hypothetical protein
MAMKIDLRKTLAAGSLLTVLLLAACVQDSDAARNLSLPGATGRTIVPGSTSTVAGDAEATSQQQKWPVGRGR